MDFLKKYATVEQQTLSAEELGLINKQTLRSLGEDEVFVFRFVACDNQIDRDYERFSEKTLEELAERFVGKTMISDHVWSAGRQVARVYAADVETEAVVKRLVLRAYALKNAETAATIEAIEGGILREVSVGLSCESSICSICATDNHKTFCEHYPGKQYEGKLCHMELDGLKEAYEVSFVAVPAQPGAGIIKRYGGKGEPPMEEDAQEEALALAHQELEEKRYGGTYDRTL